MEKLTLIIIALTGWCFYGPYLFYLWYMNNQLKIINADIADDRIPSWKIRVMLLVAGPTAWIAAAVAWAIGSDE